MRTSTGISARGLLVLVVSILAFAPAASASRPLPVRNPFPTTAPGTAREVLAAVSAGDTGRLEALARLARPSPWVVADTLCVWGSHAAAEALARAARAPDRQALVAFVRSRVGKAPNDAARSAVTDANAEIDRGEGERALSRIAGVDARSDPVADVFLWKARARALRSLARDRESAEAYRTAARVAEDLGWLAEAATAHDLRGEIAWVRSEDESARRAWEQGLALRERRGDEFGTARSLTNLGLVQGRLGNPALSRTLLLRAVSIGERVGPPAQFGVSLAHLGNAEDDLGHFEEALRVQARAVSVLRAAGAGARGELAGALGDLGRIRRDQGDLRGAYECLDAAVRLREETGDAAGLVTVLDHFAATLRLMGRAPEALRLHHRVLRLAQQVGDRGSVAAALGNIGRTHTALGEFEAAMAHARRALALFEEVGEGKRAVAVLGDIGQLQREMGAFQEALATHERVLTLRRRAGDRVGEARALAEVGGAHQGLGDYVTAIRHYEEARGLSTEIGDLRTATLALANQASAHEGLGEYAQARKLLSEARAVLEERGERAALAGTLINLANVDRVVGDLELALGRYEEARVVFEELGDRSGVALALGNVAVVHDTLGHHARALTLQHRVLRLYEELGDRAGLARTLQAVGSVHSDLGDHVTARSYEERALALHVETGDRDAEAICRGNLATTLVLLGAFDAAELELTRAEALYRGLGNPRGLAQVSWQLGFLESRRDKPQQALGHLKRALRLWVEMGERTHTVKVQTAVGRALRATGDSDGAVLHLAEAVRAAQDVGGAGLAVAPLAELARVRLARGELRLAIEAVRAARPGIDEVLAGLAEEEGASGRAKWAELFAIGCVAAVRAGDAVQALEFLEGGRARALLASLGGRRRLPWGDLPPVLREAEMEARAVLSRARWSYDRARETKRLPVIRRARSVLDDAMDGVRAVDAEVQRTATREAALFYPPPASLERLQGALAKTEALVLYGLCLDEALALVVTVDGLRLVSLGSAPDVARACTQTARDQPTSLDGDALAHLRALLVDPLDVPEHVETLIVSPDGPIAYVPFGALVTDRRVALTPSGMTHVWLRAEQGPAGDGVLALGDPVYATRPDPGSPAVYHHGRVLQRLVETATEARSVGDVVLLRDAATERGFLEALGKRARWKAVHFACHGLVDTQRPTLSALALTPGEGDDGFLTAAEVLRMRIPTDLAVLSACDTARGKVFAGEGILGLTRAFLHAGASRVLCSLWKVDDEATSVLMTKFYELWDPEGGGGVPAAEALRLAQAFLRDHPERREWSHARYWAAWVLWGDPSDDTRPMFRRRSGVGKGR